MSIEALNWSLKQQAGSPAKKALLLLLANLADEEHSCWPSLGYLTEKAEISKRTVITYINELEAEGLVKRVRRDRGYGKRLSNRYLLPIDGPFAEVEASLSAESAPSGEGEKTPDHKQGAESAPCEKCGAPLSAACCTYIETPQEKIDKSIFIETEPSGQEAAQRPDDLPNIAETDARLRDIHPSLSVTAIASRLKVAKACEVDLVRAAEVILRRASRRVDKPAAFVAASIDKSPDTWAPATASFHPAEGANEVRSRRELRQAREREMRSACARGLHDWGPDTWPAPDRSHCQRDHCLKPRRDVDAAFAALEAAEFERTH